MEYLEQIRQVLTDSQLLIEGAQSFLESDSQFSTSYEEDELNKYQSFIKVYDVVQYNMTELYNLQSRLKLTKHKLKQVKDIASSIKIDVLNLRDINNRILAQISNAELYIDIVQTHIDKYNVTIRFLNVINYNK